MARTPRKPISEQLADIEAEIAQTQERLISLKNQKKELEIKKMNQDMQELYNRMQDQGMTLDEAIAALTKTT